MVPQPVLAVLLCFPCTEAYESSRLAEEERLQAAGAPEARRRRLRALAAARGCLRGSAIVVAPSGTQTATT